jgi:hypothetical protein
MAQIRRQSETHRPNGSLQGPAPTRNQVRSVPLRIDALPGGRLRVSTPLARGWAATARTPEQLAAAITAAFTEAQVATYARWCNGTYDLDELTEVQVGDPLAAPTRTQSYQHRKRSDQHNPADWTPLSSGHWRSPSGRSYRPDATIVARVKAARRRQGID